jgi:hypothetical protein
MAFFSFQLTSVIKRSEVSKFSDLLVETAFKGLDLQSALSQPQPTYKVRHLKSGLKFILALLEVKGRTSEKLLDKGLHDQLIRLFDEPHMAVSLKVWPP